MIHQWMMSRRLRSYHDGGLREPALARIRQHVAQCGACRDELQSLQSADLLLGRARLAAPQLDPADAQRMLAAALAASGAASHRRSWFGWQLAGTAVLVLGCVAGFGRHYLDRGPVSVAAVLPRDRTIPVPATNPPLAVARGDLKVPSGLSIAPERRQPVLVGRAMQRRRRLRQNPRPKMPDRVAPAPVPEARVGAPDPPRERPYLMVLVTTEPAVLSALVTRASALDEAPGFAQVESTEVSPYGGRVVTQSTVTTCAPPVEAPVNERDEQPIPDEGHVELCDWEECNDVE